MIGGLGLCTVGCPRAVCRPSAAALGVLVGVCLCFLAATLLPALIDPRLEVGFAVFGFHAVLWTITGAQNLDPAWRLRERRGDAR
jgi:hypothetical protein